MNLADALTLSRLYAIIPISVLAILGWEQWAGALYIAAIATDAIDGAVARTQGTASKAGADLDGRVDFWFGISTLFWLALLAPQLYREHWLPVLILLAAFGAFIALSRARTGRILMPHLYSAKVTTFLYMLWLPLSIFAQLPGWLVWLTALSAVLSRTESALHVLKH